MVKAASTLNAIKLGVRRAGGPAQLRRHGALAERAVPGGGAFSFGPALLSGLDGAAIAPSYPAFSWPAPAAPGAELAFGEAAAARRAAAERDGAVAQRRLIAELLKQFKQTSEVRSYLKYFGSVDAERFAIVKVSGDVLASEAETARVAASLAFLHKIGLVPIVVHGVGLFTGRQSAEVAAAAASVPAGAPPAERAARIMVAARASMAAANARLVAALEREGVAASAHVTGVFEAQRNAELDGPLRGAVGHVTAVDVGAITAAVEAGAVPVVAALGGAPGGSAGAGDADDALTFSTTEATLALAKVVRPLKVIWLRPEGGLRTLDGARLRAIDLARDAPSLLPAAGAAAGGAGKATRRVPIAPVAELAEGAVAGLAERLRVAPADAEALAQLAQLYGVLSEPGTTVSVTSPEGLAAELFTHKGAGTVIKAGERIVGHETLDGLDLARLAALVEDSFGAALPDGYFQRLAASGRLHRIYVSESYRGVAILTREPGVAGATYLDKFAVAPDAQGDKLGEVLWRALAETEPRLYWRSRATNKVNPWYYEQATGCYKAPGGDWTVFWRGLADGDIMPAVATALALPPTFARGVYPRGAPASEGGAPAEQPVLK